jgi:hypothetical protein
MRAISIRWPSSTLCGTTLRIVRSTGTTSSPRLGQRSGMSPEAGLYDFGVAGLRVTRTYVYEKATPENPIEGDVRYWAYAFEIDGRNYGARIWDDTPDEADVLDADGTRHAEYDDDLRAIGEYLNRKAHVRTILTLGGRVGGFRPTLTFPERD